MGIYLAIPGADFSSAPGKIGATPLVAAANDPMPVLSLPGILNWWSAEDATIASSIVTWLDRVSAKALVGPNGTSSPSLSAVTANGLANPAVTFDGVNDWIDGDPSISLENNSSWLFLINTPNAAASQLMMEGANGGSQSAYALYLWPTGYVGTSAKTGVAQVNSTAGRIASSTPQIVAMSYDGAQWKFSVNGVYDKAVAPSAGGAGSPGGILRVGASTNSANKFNGHMQEIMQFAGDLLSPANAAYYGWLIRRLKARYGIA